MDTFLEVLGLVVGLFYLWYEYHASAKVWIASIIMPMISMWIYFRKGIYADFAINIYYVVIAIYGYLAWTFKSRGASKGADEKEVKPLRISHLPLGVGVGCFLTMLALWAGIYYILATFTDSSVPVPDAFTTAMSIVGLWMMARKYAEQWLVWLVVDAVCVYLYCYKGIYFYGILYSVYTVIAWFGYRKWCRLQQSEEKQEE